MDILRSSIIGPGYEIPSVVIAPARSLGAAVITHGYGGCKEEQLGLAWRVAEVGLTTYAIDLRGHGQHTLPLDDRVLDDLELAIGHCRRYGKVVAIGHSLGGRLSLTSSADYAIGISPPLDLTYCAKTQEQLHRFRSHRVRAEHPDTVFEMLKNIPIWNDHSSNRAMIVYGTRDVPEIVSSSDKLRSSSINVHMIEDALHADTYLLESTFEALSVQLSIWFGDPG